MEPIPLTLSILRLTPASLVPSSQPSSDSLHLEDVPSTPAPRPSLPSSFAFSPTHNYPAPFGTMTLGSSLAVRVQLVANPPSSPRPGENAGDIGDIGMEGDNEERGDLSILAPGVRGVKMMLEVQGPGGRWRLGEIIHGQQQVEEQSGVAVKDDEESETEGNTEEDEAGQVLEAPKRKVPILPPGEFVEMDVMAEMKELGLQVLICSVAWETSSGRKTFQRFFKFNVVAPLSIKTKIHPSQTPITQLDPERRSDVYLEVLMQNTSTESILFDKVNLEPVFGMTAKSILPSSLSSPPIIIDQPSGSEAESHPDHLGSLHPGDTRQYLFLLHPSPPPPTKSRQSVFPPVFAPGTILPLGRLDMAWLAGPYRERGRLQTSTLNRRVAPAPLIPKIVPPPTPTRTIAAPPTPGQVPGTPGRSGGSRVDQLRETGEELDQPEEEAEWEYDLAVLEMERSGVEVEKEFSARLRVGIRSTRIVSPDDDSLPGIGKIPPKALRIGVQYLTALTTSDVGQTSMPPASADTLPAMNAAGPSRPMTPISSQLRHATHTHLNYQTSPIATLPSAFGPSTVTFPPQPTLLRPALPPKNQQTQKEGEVFPLGPSLIMLEPIPFELAQEQYSTTYADSSEPPERWEAVYEVDLRFLAVEEGMARLGGVRVLVFDDDVSGGGKVGAEWETLGDIWVTS